jgi:hypothetical protein
LLLLTSAAQAQLRSTSLEKTNDKLRKEFKKRNDKVSQALVIPPKPNIFPDYKDQPNAARDAVETACRMAARESKMVFLTSGSTTCDKCAAFMNYHLLNDVMVVLGKYYVIVDIHTDFMPDGAAIFGKYAKPSFPSWVILSPEKKVMVDSYSPKGNVGYPLAPNHISYYFDALKKASPALTETELRWLAIQLQKAADMPNRWKASGVFCRVVGHDGV